MFLIGFIGFSSFTIIISNIFKEIQYNSNKKLENSGFWDLTSTPIHINDLNPSINWSKTAADNDWCSGSGTWNDPYLIENVTIDNLFTGSCIWIENSEVPFILRNCTFINSGRGATGWDSGIRLNNVSNGLITNITISFNNFRGILILDGSRNNTVSYNVVNDNGFTGLYLGSSSDTNKIIGNTFNYHQDAGIYIYNSHFNTFLGNKILGNEIGITGTNNNFSGNILNNCGFHLSENPIGDVSSHFIDSTNLVNNKPVYYYVHRNDLEEGDFDNAGQIILVDCSNFILSNINIAHCVSPITVQYCSNSIICNNNISSCTRGGIILYSSTNISVLNNNIYNYSIAVSLLNSNQNNFSLNQINNGIVGVALDSSHWNIFSENNIDGNLRGISIYNSGPSDLNNLIKENVISNSQNEGIILQNEYCRNNTIYLNQFYKNEVNALDRGLYNYWDKGSIGNYWSDYIGNDINDDGIGDTPYIVSGSGGNQDNFPLWDDGHNGSKIIIDDSATNNWDWARKHSWCSGSGTLSDPYIIFKVNINGNNTGNGILIRNSNAHFRIENSTVYNCQADYVNLGGVKLKNVNNGTIIYNTLSNNNGNSILLDDCNNIIIKENVMNNNGMAGATLLWSHYNILINNIVNNNERAFFLSESNNNKLLKNTLESNYEQSIRLSQGRFTEIRGNYIIGGGMGVRITGYNNTVSENEIYSNIYGVFFANGGWTENNTVANNSIHYNGHGIHLDGANCRYNMFYNNTLMHNTINAFDDGYSDYFDNGIIGNYWDDYAGMDADDDGIGENPYIISGLAYSQDNFPIWDDGNNGSRILIDDTSTNNWIWAKTRTWCSGSGTISDPYIIKDCVIDGLNFTSCLTIRNSNNYFKIQNCTFYNSGSIPYDGGIKLTSVSNGELIYNDCSFNNANGIVLVSCQNITITEHTINNNEISGIIIISSNNIDVINNKATINRNGQYGIFLENSNDNQISNNSINFNQIGIYLNNSNNNLIAYNDLRHNKLEAIHIESGEGNILEGNLLSSQQFELPFGILMIILIIGIVTVGITGTVLIVKKRKKREN